MAAKIEIGFQKVDPDALLPKLATAGAAGADLHAVIRKADGTVDKDGVTLKPLERVTISTGLKMDIPDGYEIQVRPRSGLAAKHGITILNAPGTLDSDFKGIVVCILVLIGATPYTIRHGDRIAQMVLAPVTSWSPRETDDVGSSDRGEGGLGSTGR